MKEEFLHFIWKNRLFNNYPFTTIDGKSIVVIDPGIYNRDSGPDFFNSRIIISETEWAGNVEIHTRSSSWQSHGHQDDHAYDNVILHVVHVYDNEAYTASGVKVDTTEIKWDETISNRYAEYISKPYTIACRDDINLIDQFVIRQWVNGLATERLVNKSEIIKPELVELRNDWEEVLYRLLAKYFGMNVNSEPFYMLSVRMPLKIIRKHTGDRLQVEALLFGMAGLLEAELFKEALNDDYYRLLHREFALLKSKYSLVPMDGWIWKFHRMRPANFPTIRISQLASLLTSGTHLFASIKEATTNSQLYRLLDHSASPYWNNHYMFGKEAGKSEKRVGKSAISMLLINCIVPLIFLYGRENSKQRYCDRAIDIAEKIKPETNRVVKEWSTMGVQCYSSFETQGLLELRERFCINRACLNCHIGSKLISLSKDRDPREKLILEDPTT